MYNASRADVSPAQLPLTRRRFPRLGQGRRRGSLALATLRSRLPACGHHRGVQVLLHDLARLLRARLAVLGAYGQAPVRAGGRARGAAAVALRLQCLGDLECMTEPFVPDHGALVDFREPVVRDTGQRDAVGADLEASVRILPHVDIAADQPAGRRRIIEQPGGSTRYARIPIISMPVISFGRNARQIAYSTVPPLSGRGDADSCPILSPRLLRFELAASVFQSS